MLIPYFFIYKYCHNPIFHLSKKIFQSKGKINILRKKLKKKKKELKENAIRDIIEMKLREDDWTTLENVAK